MLSGHNEGWFGLSVSFMFGHRGQEVSLSLSLSRARARHASAPHGPAQPPFASAIASSASNQVAPLFFSQCSSTTTSEAGLTGGPAASHASPSPPAWIEQLHQLHHRVSNLEGMLGWMVPTISHGDNSVFQEPILRPS